jgi:hypothetical protein
MPFASRGVRGSDPSAPPGNVGQNHDGSGLFPVHAMNIDSKADFAGQPMLLMRGTAAAVGMMLLTTLLIDWAAHSPRLGDPRDAQATRW